MTLITKIREMKEKQIASIVNAPIYIPERGIIAGFRKNDAYEADYWAATDGDNKHFPMGTTWLKYGLKGVADRALNEIGPHHTEEENENLRSIAEVYTAMREFVRRHAEAIDERDESRALMRSNLLVIADQPPQTLAQVLQLFFFIWRIRSMRTAPHLATATLGRLDQHFNAYYLADLKAGRTTEQETISHLCDLWYALTEVQSGDTVISLTLSGSDVDGKDCTNELSLLMLEASRIAGQTEPHISVRLHSGSPQELLDASYQRMLQGHGQPTFYFDEVVIPKLIEAGIPPEMAHAFTADGCAEIIYEGTSKIMFEAMEAVKTVELTMFNGQEIPRPGEAVVPFWTRNRELEYLVPTSDIGIMTGDPTTFSTYEEFEDAYIEQFNYQLRRKLTRLYYRRKDEMRDGVTHPLLNGSYEQVLQTGVDWLRGKISPYCVHMFSGSLPTAADCLAAIKQVVFEKKQYTIAQIQQAMRADFVGYESMRAVLQAAPKFGNDDDYVDLICRRLADNFLEQVKQFGQEKGMLFNPALIGYLFIQESFLTSATPDGRRWKDPISVHVSPTPGRAVHGPTAVLQSIAKLEPGRFFGVGCWQIELPKFNANEPEKAVAVLQTLNQFAQSNHFNMFNVSFHDVEKMRAAQKNPEKYTDLIVRVYGYSARFIDLTDELQEHVIARAL